MLQLWHEDAQIKEHVTLKLPRVSPDAEITGATLSVSISEGLIIIGFTAETKEYNLRLIK